MPSKKPKGWTKTKCLHCLGRGYLYIYEASIKFKTTTREKSMAQILKRCKVCDWIACRCPKTTARRKHAKLG